MIAIGSQAPDFTAVSTQRNSVTLSSYRGRPVALYFYPKASTPG
jgi:peroxiredoxin Q/BCP